ncbi:hypothetical protein FGB62_250g14 [Gracilaria domingensis]|nr:hypothetical protein FGB62_250g14 [Gracilaria domingensis]
MHASLRARLPTLNWYADCALLEGCWNTVALPVGEQPLTQRQPRSMRRSELGGRCSPKSDDLYKKVCSAVRRRPVLEGRRTSARLNASLTTKVAQGGALAKHDGEQRRRERLVRWQQFVADDISGKHQAIVVRSGRLVQASARDDETVVVHPCKLDELEMVDAQVGRRSCACRGGWKGGGNAGRSRARRASAWCSFLL